MNFGQYPRTNRGAPPLSQLDYMSWWAARPPIEIQIEQATSEAIPSGEQDLALNLDISDGVRSKAFSASETLAALKRRLYNRNPNVQILTLHLMDALVKNGGLHFVKELASKEFIDSYAAEMVTLRNQSRSPEVIDLMLEYLQSWALAMKGREGLGYVFQKYQDLQKSSGFKFPEPGPPISESFLDSATAPEWVDSDTCMKSGQPFSFYNRKHHCRNCGGVFLQEFCSNFVPLPHFGINEPVRVCVDCKENLQKKNPPVKSADNFPKRQFASNNADLSNRYDRELREAIELSLQSEQRQNTHSQPQSQATAKPEELDEDMKRAIEASLADMQLSEPSAGQPPSLEPPRPKVYPEDEFKGMIEVFSRDVFKATPRDAAYDRHLIDLNQQGVELQPRLIAELKNVSGRLQILEDLSGRLVALSGYYDQFLEAALSPDQQQVPDERYQPQPVEATQDRRKDSSSQLQYTPRYVRAVDGQWKATPPLDGPAYYQQEEQTPLSTSVVSPAYQYSNGQDYYEPNVWQKDRHQEPDAHEQMPQPSNQFQTESETQTSPEEPNQSKQEVEPEPQPNPPAEQDSVLIEI